MGIHPHVAAEANWDTVLEGKLESGALLPYACRLRIDSLSPTAILQYGVAGGQRWAQSDTAFGHQLKHFGVTSVAVLDRPYTGAHSAPHPLRRRGVSNHKTTGAPGHCNNQGQLLFGECGSGRAVGSPAIVGVNLDPIGAAPDLVPRDPNQVVVAVCRLRALGKSELGGALRVVAARGDDGPGRHDQSRPENHTEVYRTLESHVGVARALGSEVTRRGYARQECRASVHRGPGDPLGEGFVENLVSPRRLVVGMEQ